METAIVEIFRFDPKVDNGPKYDTYELPHEEGRSVLDVIKYIYEHYDSSLSFRYGCTVGTCYGCLLKVNGETVVGCQQPAGKRMKISPLPRQKIIKDLAVDFNSRSGHIKKGDYCT
ncbi:MAG: 2Fe-2S iron-sulfur cluster-binding protein [Thermodesulfobacteriota bacterium]|nr:2Fe-2S iron-sulfur cluster-binding protein [Thermodesulfobacteriota bacterium]